MRVNVVIDEYLLKAAQEETGLKTKKAVVVEGLRRIVKYRKQVLAIQALKGAADWRGDPRVLRESR